MSESASCCCGTTATGRCCLPNGDCLEGITREACEAQRGTFAAGQNCGPPNPCPQPPPLGCLGITSSTYGSSVMVTVPDTPLYIDYCLDPDPPPPNENGACCLPDGSCADVTAAVCSGLGGTFQGVGTTCAGTNCPPPNPQTGACCINGACFNMTASQCAAAGGIFTPPPHSCADVECNFLRQGPDGDTTPIKCGWLHWPGKSFIINWQGGGPAPCRPPSLPPNVLLTNLYGGNSGEFDPIPGSCCTGDHPVYKCIDNVRIACVETGGFALTLIGTYLAPGQALNWSRCYFNPGPSVFGVYTPTGPTTFSPAWPALLPSGASCSNGSLQTGCPQASYPDFVMVS